MNNIVVDPIAYGYCQCGCGEKTTVSQYNNSRYGYVAGEPRTIIRGHTQTKIVDLKAECIEEDCGYETHCLIWQRGVGSGYARVSHWDSKESLVHRILYIAERGPIPEGMELDHLCNISLCVNPNHMEVVTHKENLRRHHERERAEWKLLMDELRRVGDKRAQRVVDQIERRRNLTMRRTRKIGKSTKVVV